ncbi:MAG: TerB N-terminal domain-containing protein [Oscillospiraceae bacterium]|nr:TerB N-terminal domain-containing protein [Oscillospiraceae bacterium]
MKANWFLKMIFQEEEIQRPQVVSVSKNTPSKIRAARSLQNELTQSFQSRESLFLKQGKILANYEDDFEGQCTVQRYYPTYQDLSDQELRAYFSWRTKLRRGNMEKTSLAFAFLYIYELINQIGVADPEEGYQKLKAFESEYGQLDGKILPYLKTWIPNYAVYYGLNPSLLLDDPQVVFNRSITILEQIHRQEPDKIMEAVKLLAPNWLERSRFYKAHPEDMDSIIVQVLRRVSAHYTARCKKTMVDQYFGPYGQYYIRLFESAVFCDPLKRKDYEYTVDEQCAYICKNGGWYVQKRPGPPQSRQKFEDLLKAIDSIMRQEYGYRYPVKSKVKTKWIVQTIEEETRTLLAAKKAAESNKVSIDFSQLKKIRKDAAVTQEKLIVEEETDQPDEAASQTVTAPPLPEEDPSVPSDLPLNQEEYRLLQCLLYGGSTGWVQAEGYLLSVLADGINEKLYDVFQDSVLDDSPRLIEDYIDDLKEMITP